MKKNYALAAIVAKFHGPTNSRGARIGVSSQRGRRFYPYNYALSGAEAAAEAVEQYLAEILSADQAEHGPDAQGWGTIADYSVGTLPDGSYVFVAT